MHVKPARQMLTASVYFCYTDKTSFHLQIDSYQLCLCYRYLGPDELRQAPISSNSQHSDGNQAKCSLPHLQTLSLIVPAGFASLRTLGITPATGSGPTAHGHTSAFSSLGTSGLSPSKNMELVLLVQPNTSAANHIYSQALLAAQRANESVLPKDFHTA